MMHFLSVFLLLSYFLKATALSIQDNRHQSSKQGLEITKSDNEHAELPSDHVKSYSEKELGAMKIRWKADGKRKRAQNIPQKSIDEIMKNQKWAEKMAAESKAPARYQAELVRIS